MDDSKIIMRDKEMLMRIRELLLAEFAKVGIIPNPKKTQIIKLSRGFTYLKTQFFLTKTGEIITKPCHDSIVCERRKLKAFRRFVDEGIMTQEQAACSYMSWRGSLQKKNAHLSMQNMDNLYFALFAAKPWIKKKHHRKGIYHHDQTRNSGRNHCLQVPAC